MRYGGCLALLVGLAAPPLQAAALQEPTFAIHAPAVAAARPPLLVLLHGQGADERDMIGLWTDLPQTFLVVSPRAPFRNPSGGYRWYASGPPAARAADLARSRADVDALVEAVVARFGADPRQVFVGGFSQGAVLAYQLALREPGRFRGGAILSGALFASDRHGLAGAGRPGPALFVGHGTADDRIPFATTMSARNVIAKLGASVEFHAYPGMGHTIGAAETADLSAWLVRMTTPAR